MNQFTKKALFIVCAALMLGVCAPAVSFADDAQGQEQAVEGHHHHHHHHHHWIHRAMGKAFRVGVCTGQTLAQQGIVLPAPVQGERPKLDEPTKAALKAAVKACKTALFGDEEKKSDESSSDSDSSIQ